MTTYFIALNHRSRSTHTTPIISNSSRPFRELRVISQSFDDVVRTNTGEEKLFFDALVNRGIKTRVKDLQEYYGGLKKADWDVGIAVDAIKTADRVDVVVLVSGDGDYVPLVDYLQNHGNRVEVLAFGKSTSTKLREAADEFIDLGEDSAKYLLKKSRWPAIKIIK